MSKTASKLIKSPIFAIGIIFVVGYVLFRKIALGNTTIGNTTPMRESGFGSDSGGGGGGGSIGNAIANYDAAMESRLALFDTNIQSAIATNTTNLQAEMASNDNAISQEVVRNKLEADTALQNMQTNITQLEQPAPTYNIQPVGQPITTIAAAKRAWSMAHASGNRAGEAAAHAAADRIRGHRTNSSGTNG